MNEDDNHMHVWSNETWESAHDRAWDRWATEVEALLGHDLDGSLVEDGYALDYAYDMWELGLTPADAVARIEDNKARLRRKRARERGY